MDESHLFLIVLFRWVKEVTSYPPTYRVLGNIKTEVINGISKQNCHHTETIWHVPNPEDMINIMGAVIQAIIGKLKTCSTICKIRTLKWYILLVFKAKISCRIKFHDKIKNKLTGDNQFIFFL